jgi:hypothetical protein
MKWTHLLAVLTAVTVQGTLAHAASVDEAVQQFMAAVNAQGGKVGLCTNVKATYASGKLEITGNKIHQVTNELVPMENESYDLNKNVHVLIDGHDSEVTVRFARSYFGVSASVSAQVHPILTLVYQNSVLTNIGWDCEGAEWVKAYKAAGEKTDELKESVKEYLKTHPKVGGPLGY